MIDAKNRIMDAAIQSVRRFGLDGVRIQNISKLAGIASSNIYFYFTGKDDLLRACFDRVDRQIACVFDRIKLDPQTLAQHPDEEVRRLWTAYYRWLVGHPDETVFYHRYRDSPGFPAYDRTRDFSHFASFIGVVQMFQSQYHIYDRVDQKVLWLHVLTGTVMYAKYVVQGELPDTPETEESLFRLIMYGLQGLLQAE